MIDILYQFVQQRSYCSAVDADIYYLDRGNDRTIVNRLDQQYYHRTIRPTRLMREHNLVFFLPPPIERCLDD